MVNKPVLIWDLPLRVFHWLFAAAIIGCWVTHELGSEYIDWHMRLGYAVLALVTFRIIWGFLGSRYSKFNHFIKGPRAVVAYLKSGQPTTTGHNPLGSLMVIAMLVLGITQAVSGLFVDDEIFTTGPYFNALGKEADSVMAYIHHNGFNIIGAAIIIHIAAIIYYQAVKKQNLVKPMITGYKSSSDVESNAGIRHSRVWLGLIIAVLCTAFVYWLVVVNAPPVVDDYYY